MGHFTTEVLQTLRLRFKNINDYSRIASFRLAEFRLTRPSARCRCKKPVVAHEGRIAWGGSRINAGTGGAGKLRLALRETTSEAPVAAILRRCKAVLRQQGKPAIAVVKAGFSVRLWAAPAYLSLTLVNTTGPLHVFFAHFFLRNHPDILGISCIHSRSILTLEK